MSPFVKLLTVSLVLLASAGCVRHNADYAILAELVPGPAGGFSHEGIAAEYLTFEDELTASVFRSMERRYRIAPTGTALLCPSNRAEGLHGFNVRGRVIQRMGNQAIAAVEQRCLQPGGAISISSEYLLTRGYDKWKIEKALSGSVTVLSTNQVIGPPVSMALNRKRDMQRLLAGIRVDHGREVRIAVRGKGRIQASALSQRGDTVFLENDEGTHLIGIADVDSVWAQKGTAAALLGAIAATPCAILGMMIGNFIATDPDGNRPMPGVVGALVGGTIAALPCGLVGGAIGSFIRRWQLEYPGPGEPSG